MKIAILSDIHGNYEALTAVLKDIEREDVERIISLGDNVGYGPDSGAVIDELIAHDVLSVQGNHERAMFDSSCYEGLNFQAQENNDAIKESLTVAQGEYCQNLPVCLKFGGVSFVHGFPPDSVNSYFSEQDDGALAHFFKNTFSVLTVVGHTHRLSLAEYSGGQVLRRALLEDGEVLRASNKYIISAGSVGQPRTKDKRAQYLIWNTDTSTLTVHRLEYDAESCAKKIRAKGWPEIYALRLLPSAH